MYGIGADTMMPHINDLAAKRDDFWRGLTKIVRVILAGSVALVVFVVWRFV